MSWLSSEPLAPVDKPDQPGTARLFNFNKRHWPRTIRSQLLLAVNMAMAVLVAGFLVLDYRRELVSRLEQKQIALEEEAKTILPAVLQLRPAGAQAVQEHLDAVCGRMYDAQSPGHHIAVRMGDNVLQAQAHRRSSPAIFRAMEEASVSPEHRAAFGDRELVVGRARLADEKSFETATRLASQEGISCGISSGAAMP